MRQVIEKSFLDWSRDKTPRIQARGWAAVLEQKERAAALAKVSNSSRFVWPSSFEKGGSRYISRRIGLS